MIATLARAIVLGLPIVALLGFSLVRLARTKSLSALLQLLGAVSLMVVVLTHVAEALRLFPGMGWGEPHSVGHYTDLSSAVLGSTSLVAAFVMSRRAR